MASRAADKLANFFSSHQQIKLIEEDFRGYQHMGATLADSVLQAGLNYKTVVKPRVLTILNKHPESCTTSKLLETISLYGANQLLNWNHPEKPKRFTELCRCFYLDSVETEVCLNSWLKKPANIEKLIKVRGIGPKTVDYLKNLVGVPTVAIDRHVRRFAVLAGVSTSRYEDLRDIFTEAAQVLNISPSALDYSVWSFFSRQSPPTGQKMPPTSQARMTAT